MGINRRFNEAKEKQIKMRRRAIIIDVVCVSIILAMGTFIFFGLTSCKGQEETDFTGEGRVCLLTPNGEHQTSNMVVVVVGQKVFADGSETRGSLTLNGKEEGCFVFRNGAQNGVDVRVLESPCFRADQYNGVDLTEPFTINLYPGTGIGCWRSNGGQFYPVCSQFEFEECSYFPPEVCEGEIYGERTDCCRELLESCCDDPVISANQPGGNDICDEYGF
jgi:hypothetical protein